MKEHFARNYIKETEFYFQTNSVMNSLKCPKSKSLSHFLTESFQIYQNMRRRDNSSFDPLSHHIILKIYHFFKLSVSSKSSHVVALTTQESKRKHGDHLGFAHWKQEMLLDQVPQSEGSLHRLQPHLKYHWSSSSFWRSIYPTIKYKKNILD